MKHRWKLHEITLSARAEGCPNAMPVWYCEGCNAIDRDSVEMPDEADCPGKWPRTEEDLEAAETALRLMRGKPLPGAFGRAILADLERAVRERRGA